MEIRRALGTPMLTHRNLHPSVVSHSSDEQSLTFFVVSDVSFTMVLLKMQGL